MRWTLWEPSRLQEVLRDRCARPVSDPSLGPRCPCGRWRAPGLLLANFDASSYFTNANRARGLSALRQLFRRLEAKGFDGVHILDRRKSLGRLHSSRTHVAPKKGTLVSFDAIRAALRYVDSDGYIIVNDLV